MTRPEAYEDVGAVVRAAAATVRAPERLRADVAARRRRPRRAWTLRLAAPVGAAVALAVALVLAGSGPPSVQDVAAAALRSPTQPAPATDPTDRRFVRAEVGGVRFPDYQRPWGWHAIGARTDEIDGRHALTVVYGKDGLGVHYTVVDGAPLRLPNAVRRAKKDGPRIAAMRDGGTSVIAWHQGGHTCVLASRDLDTKALMHFAAWR